MELVYFCVLNLDGREFMGEVPVRSQWLLLYWCNQLHRSAHWWKWPIGPHHVLRSVLLSATCQQFCLGQPWATSLNLALSSEIRGDLYLPQYFSEDGTRRGVVLLTLRPCPDGGLTALYDWMGLRTKRVDEILRWSSRFQYFRRSFLGERQEKAKKSHLKKKMWPEMFLILLCDDGDFQ